MSENTPREAVTVDELDMELDGTYGGLTPLSQALVPHSMSHSLDSLGGLELSTNDVVGVHSEGLAERLAGCQMLDPSYEVDMDRATAEYFASCVPINCSSIYSKEPLDFDTLTSFCSRDGGYVVHSPNASDRMWRSPKRGWQSITDVSFAYGFRLPMHPFFMTVLRTFDCAIGQLAPNTILQISGLIARCEELKEYPSMKLLLSIYRAKTTGAQVYFDKKPGCVKLVKNPSSNSGYHPRFAWYEGGELVQVGPWKRLSNTRMKVLSQKGSMPVADLVKYFGEAEVFHPSSFTETKFLHRHCLAGPKLQKLLRNPNAMPSDSMTALLLKKPVGASPSKTHSPEAEEAHTGSARGNSPETAVNDIAPIGGKDPEVESGSSKGKGRKRHRDGGSGKSHHKRSKEASLKDSAKGVVDEVATAGSESSSIKACKAYAEKLMFELEKLKLVDEDLLEMDRLKKELAEVTLAKAEAERREAHVVQEKRTVDGKNLKLLVERSALISECDSLGAAVKRFEVKLAELQGSLVEKEDLIKNVEGERDRARSELGVVSKQLADLQTETLKSYEEGYRDCWERFAAGVSVDPSANTFENFLADLREKASRDGAASSNQAPEAEA